MAETRRYVPIQPLDIGQILREAQHRCLRPAEICELLRNHKKFRLAPEPPDRPSAGCLFLFDRRVVRYFRKDGHRWRKKKDRKTVEEAHEKLKAGSVDILHSYCAHGEDNENFQRQIYWMLDGELENIVLVHYREVKEGSKLGGSCLLNADPGSQFGSPQVTSAPCSEQTNSPIPTGQTSYASRPNSINWNEQKFFSAFNGDPGEDPTNASSPGTSSLAQPIHVSVNASALANEATGFLELSRGHLDAGFVGAGFNRGASSLICADICGSHRNSSSTCERKLDSEQLNAADFLTHKLTDARLDADNTVQDVSCGDRLIPDGQRTAQMFGLKCSVVFDHEDMELVEDEYEARTIALDEIKNVLKMVCDVHDLPLALAWVPCKAGWPCKALVDGGIFPVSGQFNKADYSLFKFVNNLHHLKKGVRGVVGNALLSTSVVFCRDVTQLSLTEYPLAHYAQKAGLSGCFAICLQSSCTGNDVYVLEFFMPVSNKTNENPHTSLRKILETMRKDFRTLRVASGEELGEDLHIEEIGIQNGEKLDPVQMLQTTMSLAQPELSQSVIEVMQADSSDQQLVNTINTGSNVGGTERNDIAITCTQEKGIVKASKRKANKSGGTVKASTRKGDKFGGTVKSSDREDNKKGVKIEISLEEILQTSKMKLEDAAQSLGVSKSTLKRVCRDYGINRWPPRKKNKVVCSQLNESAPCVDMEQSSQLNLDDLPSAQPSATIVYTEPHDTMMQDANVVTIKAKYAEGNAIKFRLPLSLRLIELQQEVLQRLNLEAGTYSVKYKDGDGDLILIGCDEDLRDYMCVSRLEGKTCIVVLLEPKQPITDHL